MFRSRPFGVTLLLWMVLTLIVWGAARCYASLYWQATLVRFESSLSVGYLSVTGAGWAAAGGVLLWGILTGAPRTRPAIPMAVTIWLIEYWVERSFFESPQVNLPFAAAVSLLVLSLTLIITWHKGTKEFFSRSEEYEQQNQNPGSQ